MEVRRAAIYARISRHRKAPNGGADKAGPVESDGVARQAADCQTLADREGWTVVEVYKDDDKSAYNGKERPAWKRLLADAGDGRFDTIIAWHDDRLWRNVIEQQVVFELCRDVGVQTIATVQRVYHTGSDDDGFLSGIQALVAQRESADKARRIRRKHEELARDGKVANGGWRPFGYDADRVTIRPAEAEAIRDAADRLLAGASVQSILRDWQARGITAVAGRAWHTTAFSRMITSRRIAGLREHRGEVAGKAVWPPIIDQPTHEALRRLMLNGRRRQPARSYLLSGIARCGLCGAVLLSKRSTRKGRQHWCHSSPEHGGCGRIAIMADPLEAEVRDQVIASLAGPGLARALEAAAGEDEEQRRLSDRLAADEQALAQLARDHYADRLIGRAEYLAAREALEDRIHHTRTRLRPPGGAGVLTGLPADAGGLRAVWDGGDLELRRAVLSAVVERVVIHSAARNGGRFDPDRIEVIWRV